MPGAARSVLTLVTKAAPLIMKYGPRAAGAAAVLTKFLHDNPGVPTWFRKRMTDVPDRMTDVQKRHGEAAKIQGSLDIIRDVARDAERAGESIDAESYVQRADRIERGVRLVETQNRHDRKPLLARLKSDTDALLAEVLQAVSGSGHDDGDTARPA